MQLVVVGPIYIKYSQRLTLICLLDEVIIIFHITLKSLFVFTKNKCILKNENLTKISNLNNKKVGVSELKKIKIHVD
jgi:hypothetical protein